MSSPKQTVFNFKPQFVAAVESGLKTTTIRAFRNTLPPLSGDQITLCTGMRTKKYRRIKTVACQGSHTIYIAEDAIHLGGEELNVNDQNELARGDGFTSLAAFKDFFRNQYGLPFVGTLVDWH